MDPGINFHSDTIIFELARILKPGGSIFFQEPIYFGEKKQTNNLRSKEEFESSILISGLEIEKTGEPKSQSFESFEFVEELSQQLKIEKQILINQIKNGEIKFTEFSTKKPQIQFGSSHSISFKSSNNNSINTNNNLISPFSLDSNNKKTKTFHTDKLEKKEVWKINLDEMEDEELDFIEEEKLLLKEDLIKEKIVSFDPNDDCGTGSGKLKACKNCTCGRAEMLENGDQPPSKKITLEDLENGIDLPESSCGSCFLGDAFRCPTCPMLGLPAFKPNEKVKLNLN